MKKAFLLIASAALLFAGCQKEQIAQNAGNDGDQVTVTFTAGLAPEGTKAVIDGDGAAANVNHWVLEVYDNQGLFYREERPNAEMPSLTTDTSDELHQTYQLKLFKNQAYTLLFWADTKDAYTTADLTAVSTVGSVANNDSRDAFYAKVPYTSLVSESKYVTLTRPFAQLNIITNDLEALKSKVAIGAYDKYAPAGLQVKATVPTTFNLMTETAGQAVEQTLTAAVSYGSFSSPSLSGTTLFMDYIFASTSKELKDMKFSFTSNSNEISYDFTNIPLQRNYRTNIKGQLMSNDSEWTVTIDPVWNSLEEGNPDYNVYYYEASSVSDAQQYIQNNDSQESKTVDLSKATIAQTDVQDGTIKFELTQNSPADQVNFTLPEIPSNIVNCSGWKITNDGQYQTQNVNVTAPQGTSVIIDAPISHVTLNGSEYQQVTATTGENSLVIPQGVSVAQLTIAKGGVEIHGTVVAASVTGTTSDVFVRECENLSETVYNALKNYIDPRYCSKENDTTPKTYDIVLNAVAEINGVTYPTLAEAVEAATAGAVVKLVKDIDLNARVEVSEKEISLDLNGKTIEYKGAQLNSGILLVHNGAGLTINGEGFIKSGTGAYAAIALTKSGDNANNPAKLTVNGGTIEGHYYGIVGNGNRHNTQIVINDGTITSTDSEATAIYHPQNGTLTINGGLIKGENGLYIKSGTVANISGATIEATGDKGEYKFNGDGFEHTGDALIVDNCNYPGGRPTVTIGDATLISAHGFQVGAYFSAPETGISDIYKTVNTAFTVPEGYEWNEDGKLVKGAVVVHNQDEFVAACAAAVSGDKLVLGSGTFAITSSIVGAKELAFKGQGVSTIIRIGGSGDGNQGTGISYNKLSFESLSLSTPEGKEASNYTGFTSGGELYFKNVTFLTGFSNWGNQGKPVTFIDCTFNQYAQGWYCVQELRVNPGTKFLFDNCKFICTKDGRFINAYTQYGGDAGVEIVVKDCTFDGSASTQSKAALNLKSNLSDGCVITLYLLGNNTTNNVKSGSNTGESLFDDNGTYATVYQGTDKDSASIIWQNGAKVE